jgi:hypothetical protein
VGPGKPETVASWARQWGCREAPQGGLLQGLGGRDSPRLRDRVSTRADPSSYEKAATQFSFSLVFQTMTHLKVKWQQIR